MTAEGTGVFLTDAGAEISVRAVQHHSSTATTTLEPLYATDLDVMDGVTGELLRKTGERLRGTLRRRGNVFVLSPEPTQDKVLTKAGAPVSRPARGVDPDERAPQTPRPETEASETPPPIAQVRRAERPKRSETKTAPPPAATLPAAPAATPPVARTTASPAARAAAPPAVPAGARRAKPKEQPSAQLPVAPPPPPTVDSDVRRTEPAPSQSEAIEALKIVARFLREPSAAPAPMRAEPSEPPESAPSQAEAIEAVRAVAQFLLDERSIPLQEAKHAQSIVSRFLAAVRATEMI